MVFRLPLGFKDPECGGCGGGGVARCRPAGSGSRPAAPAEHPPCPPQAAGCGPPRAALTLCVGHRRARESGLPGAQERLAKAPRAVFEQRSSTPFKHRACCLRSSHGEPFALSKVSCRRTHSGVLLVWNWHRRPSLDTVDSRANIPPPVSPEGARTLLVPSPRGTGTARIRLVRHREDGRGLPPLVLPLLVRHAGLVVLCFCISLCASNSAPEVEEFKT